MGTNKESVVSTENNKGRRHSRNKKIYYEQFPYARAMRLSSDLDREVNEYLWQNSLSFNQLCYFAVSQFIAVSQRIELAPIANSKKRLWDHTESRNELISQPPVVSAQPKRRTALKDESQQRAVRFTPELDLKVQEYLVKNDLSFSQLCQFAIGKFISKHQIIELSVQGRRG
jgi:hypothetical protein